MSRAARAPSSFNGRRDITVDRHFRRNTHLGGRVPASLYSERFLMRGLTIGGVAIIAASILLLAALPQDAASARLSVKYGDRLQQLIGKRFHMMPERDRVVQNATGDYKLVAVGVDFAEFHSDDTQVLVPLSVLRVSVEVPK